MDHAEARGIERVINRELEERFPDGTILRAELRQHDDDPAIEPGQLMVRVFIPAPGERAEYQGALAAFQDAHRTRLETLRRELSARLPEARLLEFTFDDPDPATPRIELPDDGEPMSGREIVTTAVALLRENYVFPEVAERAATAVETRLAAGEYDDLDEPALAELLTGHLNEICDDKHLRVRARGPRPGGPGPGGPAPGGPGPGGPGPGGPGPRRSGGPGPRPGGEEPEDHEARVLAMRRMGRLDNFG